MIAAGGVIPAVLMLALLPLAGGFSLFAAILAGLAVIFHLLGMLAERWLFFAEARHAVMNYYGG